MRLEELTKAVPGHVTVLGYTRNEITSLCTDSRKVEKGALFFCIPGLRTDAHDFGPMVAANGASALVVERRLDVDCAQVVVRNVREALSYMAAAFYGNPAKKLKMIGITGTKGKTTVSFLVKSILEAAGHKVGLIGTVCSMIGEKSIPANLTTPDPVEFQKMLRDMADQGAEYVVMEVSAHALAMHRLDGVHYLVGGFTNFSQDHLDFFGTMDRYLDTKMRFLTPEFVDQVVYNADDLHIQKRISELDLPKTTIGIRVDSAVHANDIEITERGCSFRLTFYKRFTFPVELHLSGIFNVYNAMMAAALCDAAGIDRESLRQGLETLRNVPGRIELLETDTPYRVILDYAHSPDALENILTTVRQTSRPGAQVIALFGCGGDRDHEKRPIMGEIGGKLSDFVILTSDNPRSEDPYAILRDIEEGIKRTKTPYVVIENRREAIRRALTIAKPGDVVVLAGKGHETYQEIQGVKHAFDEKIVVAELLTEIHGAPKLPDGGENA